MIVSLIYASRSLMACDDPAFADNMAAIREGAMIVNIRTGITGFLFYFDDKFVQIIEGDFDDVADLYKRIRRDRRHGDCRIVEFREIERRHFREHAMEDSMDFIARNHTELKIGMSFLNKFIGESIPGGIRLSDLLHSIAAQVQGRPEFPRLPTSRSSAHSAAPPLI